MLSVLIPLWFNPFSIRNVNMNPKVKVRVPDQEEEFFYTENSRGSWMFSKFIELLYFEEKNQRECPPSVSKSIRACPQHVTMRSTPSTKGVLKSMKRLGESPKENARACSVIRPRAVLSSPENDGLIGSINELNNGTSSTSSRKKDARGRIESQAKVLCTEVKEGKFLDREECEALNKGKTPLKAKVHVGNFLH
ncbi:unnamed protein product [Sphenostylis stenocarpa]|uniref:Uncharacterized protein n=1 Tax=Sphenostylis stenocarpa TaxID=92480 RepID=A0AA86T145_9FABA|nr:unnamed protein product [Sphenostylis stenocarpa]